MVMTVFIFSSIIIIIISTRYFVPAEVPE